MQNNFRGLKSFSSSTSRCAHLPIYLLLWQVRVESAEETLRVLLMESDRIREMVSEAECKTRSWLEAKTAQVRCVLSAALQWRNV